MGDWLCGQHTKMEASALFSNSNKTLLHSSKHPLSRQFKAMKSQFKASYIYLQSVTGTFKLQQNIDNCTHQNSHSSIRQIHKIVFTRTDRFLQKETVLNYLNEDPCFL